MSANLQPAIQALADRVAAMAPNAADADAAVRLGKALEGLINADAVGAVEAIRDGAVLAVDAGKTAALADVEVARIAALAVIEAATAIDLQMTYATLLR
jgi:hypothetical protein